MRTLLALSIVTVLGPPLTAQTERLGTITFPTSGSPAAQEHFIRGTLYLHSFEYEAAAEEFREAQRLEPGFAMAYWGEAMTYNHPVWDQQDKAAALAVLNRLGPTRAARAAQARTPREKAWLHAVEVLYGEGTKAERDTLYSGEMERLVRAAPDDDEAQSFYALSLLGLSQATRVVPTYLRAGEIALAVMQRNPDHPGATHYVIHAFDDPVHAQRGLDAARAYSKIAPGAAHAQHMTTHIFLALGMWDNVVNQNVVALGPDSSRWVPGHYSSWLLYGLLQQGRFADSRRLLDLMARTTEVGAPLSQRATLVLMRDYYLINTGTWHFALTEVNLEGIGPVLRAANLFTSGYAALEQNQIDQARTRTQELRRLTDGTDARQVGAMAYELAGLVHVSDGDTAGGLNLLRLATGIEDSLPMDFGPPLILKPTHEALGEVYLQLNRPADARREFERALELAPRRMRSLLGLARAMTRSGNSQAAAHAWNELIHVLHLANLSELGIPELTTHGATSADQKPDNLHDLLTYVCVFENSYRCAVDALEVLYAIDSSRADSTFFTRITVFAAQPTESPDTTRLIKWAQAGVNKYPTNLTLLHQLLGAYAMQGQMDSTMSLARRLIELDTTTAAPVLLVVNELAKRDSIMKALPLVDLIARRGSRDEKENAAILLVNAAFKILQHPADESIGDTVRLGRAADLSRRAVQLADTGGRAWPNANYALGLSIVFFISRIDSESEKQQSCGLTRREDQLTGEAATALARGRQVNPTQVDQYLHYLETLRPRIDSNRGAYCV